MTFSHDRKTIYGAGMKKWNSFSVNSPTDIVHHSSHALAGHPKANDADTKTRAIFVLAANKPPYNVYGNPFYDYAGYGNVFSVDEKGGLKENVQNYPYQDNTAIHGMVFDKNEEYLYSADMWANKVWTHKKVCKIWPLIIVPPSDISIGPHHWSSNARLFRRCPRPQGSPTMGRTLC